MSNVSLERYYFVVYDGALTLKISKMALNAFCDKTLHIYLSIYPAIYLFIYLYLSLFINLSNLLVRSFYVINQCIYFIILVCLFLLLTHSFVHASTVSLK